MRKKLLAIIATLAMVMTMIPTVAFADGDAAYEWYGDGTATEYTLTSAADLQGFANIVNGTDGRTAYDFASKTVKLGADIDLAGMAWTPIGVAGKAFSGIFDGQNNAIKNLTITSDAERISLRKG